MSPTWKLIWPPAGSPAKACSARTRFSTAGASSCSASTGAGSGSSAAAGAGTAAADGVDGAAGVAATAAAAADATTGCSCSSSAAAADGGWALSAPQLHLHGRELLRVSLRLRLRLRARVGQLRPQRLVRVAAAVQVRQGAHPPPQAGLQHVDVVLALADLGCVQLPEHAAGGLGPARRARRASTACSSACVSPLRTSWA
jgi:hypothetical protein